MKYYLGIDGGGSKTAAVLCDETGKTAASFVGGSINFNAIGTERTRQNLKAVVDGVLKGFTGTLSAAVIGSAALAERADEALTRTVCEGIIPCDRVVMESDVFIGLEAMRCKGPVAMVISGTGSMAAGRKADGTVIHTGGWGYLLGDEGSGYAMALDGIKAAIRGDEGTGDKTALTADLLAFFDVRETAELIDIFYNPAPEPSRVAKFAPFVLKNAEAGDEAALRIMNDHALSLAKTVNALLARLPAGTPLGLWGGIFQNSEIYREAFARAVNAEYPQTAVGLLPVPPEYGAAFAAMAYDEQEE